MRWEADSGVVAVFCLDVGLRGLGILHLTDGSMMRGTYTSCFGFG